MKRLQSKDEVTEKLTFNSFMFFMVKKEKLKKYLTMKQLKIMKKKI